MNIMIWYNNVNTFQQSQIEQPMTVFPWNFGQIKLSKWQKMINHELEFKTHDTYHVVCELLSFVLYL